MSHQDPRLQAKRQKQVGVRISNKYVPISALIHSSIILGYSIKLSTSKSHRRPPIHSLSSRGTKPTTKRLRRSKKEPQGQSCVVIGVELGCRIKSCGEWRVGVPGLRSGRWLGSGH